MDDEIRNSDYQNDWANDIKSTPIHIDNAQSGAKGYYCLGCGKEMQAVKYKNPNHQSYFRHHASNIDNEKTECVVASKVYREKIAQQILQRLKCLKVPTLLKYPPIGQDGQPMFLEESKTITAHKVKSQLTFYENEEGEIMWGKNKEIDERYLLIRPDVTFFDINETPILFIEFVITHKISDEKRVKLNRIGIDTVQIIIPKVPEPEIEKSLKSVSKVKWVYNEIEANTKYIPPAKGDAKRIFPVDEEQRRLLDESFACTTAKIGNLIRSIKRSLESQSYRNAKHLFEQEISRIERATRKEEQELGKMEKKFEEEIFSEFKGEFESFEDKRRDFEERERAFKKSFVDLEKRYINKTIELKEEESGIGQAIGECREIGTTKTEVEVSFRIEEEAIREQFEREEGEIERELEFERKLFKDYQKTERELPVEFGKLEKQEHQRFATAKSQIDKETRDLERTTGDLEKKIENFGEYAIERGRELETEFEKIGKQSLKRIEQRDSGGSDPLSSRIKDVLEAGRISSNFDEKLKTYERYRKALEFARSGTWKRK